MAQAVTSCGFVLGGVCQLRAMHHSPVLWSCQQMEADMNLKENILAVRIEPAEFEAEVTAYTFTVTRALFDHAMAWADAAMRQPNHPFVPIAGLETTWAYVQLDGGWVIVEDDGEALMVRVGSLNQPDGDDGFDGTAWPFQQGALQYLDTARVMKQIAAFQPQTMKEAA